MDSKLKQGLLSGLQKIAGKLDYAVIPAWGGPAAIDEDPEFPRIARSVRSYTMTSYERVLAVVKAAEHVAIHRIPGAIVECGVWRGGSMMAAAATLMHMNRRDREFHLFDTYGVMPDPVADDGESTLQHWANIKKQAGGEWSSASAESVRRNIESTGYPGERLHLIEGRVEDTIPDHAPDQIALLRLDTDWYESTKHELEHLYPRLVPGGLLLLDDYGHWPGCRKAVDEYFAKLGDPVYLARIDYTGRVAVKPRPAGGGS